MANSTGTRGPLDPIWLGDAIRAVIELGIARIGLASSDARALVAFPPTTPPQFTERQVALIARVAYVIPRIAARLPWRADCLVQALAARRWLGSHGIVAKFTLGVPKDISAGFEAHAWLTVGEKVVTGGDISAYVPLVRS